MSNFGTMVQRIGVETQRADLSDEIRLSIIDACEDLASEQDQWNEGEWEFTTTDGVSLYKYMSIIGDSEGSFPATASNALIVASGGSSSLGYSRELPHDWLEPIGPIWLFIGGSDNSPVKITPKDYEEGDELRFFAGDAASTPYAAYWVPEGLRLVPSVSGTHTLRGRYKKRLWTPTASYDGTSWSFDPDESTSELFYNSEAARLVRRRAVHFFVRDYLDDPVKEGATRAAFARELSDKREEDSKNRSTGRIRPWGFYV